MCSATLRTYHNSRALADSPKCMNPCSLAITDFVHVFSTAVTVTSRPSRMTYGASHCRLVYVLRQEVLPTWCLLCVVLTKDELRTAEMCRARPLS